MVAGAIAPKLRAVTICNLIITCDVVAQVPNEFDTFFFEMLYSIRVLDLVSDILINPYISLVPSVLNTSNSTGWHMMVMQAAAYEKQGRATIACLITKFRSYRRVKSRTPPTK